MLTFTTFWLGALMRPVGAIVLGAYLDEMGRRWDADPNRTGTREAYIGGLRSRWDEADRNNRGMTPAEVSRLTGKVDSTMSSVPKTGSGAQPGRNTSARGIRDSSSG